MRKQGWEQKSLGRRKTSVDWTKAGWGRAQSWELRGVWERGLGSRVQGKMVKQIAGLGCERMREAMGGDLTGIF